MRGLEYINLNKRLTWRIREAILPLNEDCAWLIPKVEAGLARLGVLIFVEVLSMLFDLNVQFKRELKVLQGVKNVGVILLHDLHG